MKYLLTIIIFVNLILFMLLMLDPDTTPLSAVVSLISTSSLSYIYSLIYDEFYDDDTD